MNITFEFATQDDCLEKMVPSDLRSVVSDRDYFKNGMAELQDIIDKIQPERDTLKQQNAELAAQVDRLMNAALDAFPLLNGSPEKVRLCGALRATPAQCLLKVKAEAVSDLKFPVMLRKMWSGGEVLEWLKEQANKIRGGE